MACTRALVALLVLALIAPVPILAQQPRLKDVLARAGRYVEAYGEQLSAVVAREEYVQNFGESEAGSFSGDAGGAKVHGRTLVSEFALIQVSGNGPGWEGFRDVYEVNGQPVHDRRDRLERLFADSPGSALQQARTIADESARYNIGPLVRNFNVPTAVLFFLHPSNQPRFRFAKNAQSDISGHPAWVIGFEERQRPTIIRTPANKNVPAKGRVWIDVDTGRVLRTELQVSGFLPQTNESSATVSVDYGLEQALGLWVPIEMREKYTSAGTTVSVTTCVARYSNYRRFTTDARLVPPK